MARKRKRPPTRQSQRKSKEEASIVVDELDEGEQNDDDAKDQERKRPPTRQWLRNRAEEDESVVASDEEDEKDDHEMDESDGKEWDFMYGKLVEFKRHTGHTEVSAMVHRDPYFSKKETRILQKWLHQQRQAHKHESLSENHKARLDDIGLEWEESNTNDEWENMFDRLVKFKQKHGHCTVPDYEDSKTKKRSKQKQQQPNLADWCDEQRDLMKSGMLSDNRTWRLDEVGLVWEPTRGEPFWCQMLEHLHAFKEQYGHCLVPTRYKRDRQLGQWVNNLRRRRSSVPNQRRKQLEEVGFVWNVREPTR